MKLWILLFDLGTLFLIARTLSLCRMPLGLCVIYGWCPLVLKEFANSGHFDSIAVFFATLAVALLVESIARFKGQQRNSRDRSRWIHPVVILAALALAAGIGAKLYPIVLAPMFFLVAGRKLGWRATLLPTVICAAFTLILLWPLLPPSLRGPLGGNVKSPTAPTEKVPADHQPPSPKPAPEADEGPSDTAAGMTAFLKRWEMNDWIFMLVIENLKLQRVFPDRPPVWFSVTPDAWRQGVVDWVVGKGWAEPRDAPFLITRTVTSFVFLLIALALAWCASRSDEPAVWFRIAFLTIAWFWLLSPTQNPWYWTWALPLLAFARLRAWMAVSGLVLIYYLRFWLGYHYPDAAVLGTPYNGHAFFDYVVTWFEFAPWFAWLALEWWLGRHRIESVDVDMKSE